MPFLGAADGTLLSYESYGEGDTVVFCNSCMLSTNMWRYIVASLVEQGYRCVLLDWRGHGRSDRPPAGYDLDTLAGDVAAVVDELGLNTFRLVGHSMGTAVALRYLAGPGANRVSQLVLISSMLPFLKQTDDNPDAIPEGVFDGLLRAVRHDFSRWLADQQQAFFASHLHPVSPAAIDWVRRDCESASLQAVLALQQATFNADNRPYAESVTVPTLILHGAADFSAPVELTGRRIAKSVPHAVYKEYPDAGHGIFVTHHEAVSADLVEFFSGV